MEGFMLSDMQLVCNEALDAQHRSIFDNMAKVYEYLMMEKKDQDLLDLLEVLDAYCKLHIFDEERVMSEMDFPSIEVHKAQHMLFVRHLEVFMSSYEESNCAKNIDALNFLKGWFLEHIMVFDKRYSVHGKRSHNASQAQQL